MLNAVEVSSISENYQDKSGNELLYINHLNKINIFIGENNSGKSRMLRHMVNSNDTKALTGILSEDNKTNYDRIKRVLMSNIRRFNEYSTNQILIPEKFNELDDCNYLIDVNAYIKNMKLDVATLNANQRSYFNNIRSNLNEMYEYLSKGKGHSSTKINDLDITYIPVLRGIENYDIYYQFKENDVLKEIALNNRQLQAMNEYKENAKHIYSNKISKAYTIDKRYIFTAENLFDEVKQKLLGKEADRNVIREFEKFISNEFYDGKGFTIIPNITEGVLYVKIGDVERKLHDLGDGIKQLITIFYKLFEKKNKDAIFFIEEPEINLHPGYQRQFIEIIQNNSFFKNHQFFITTHSNHLIDRYLDYDNISIYKFINVGRKNNLFKVINTSNKDLEILDLLGVYNSSVFISNCTIWVEGISDKILISKYLEVYLRNIGKTKYKEDINYAFIEYGGNNIEHWSFKDDNDIETINASGITNRCFIICDNDGGKKAERKEKLKKVFGKKNFYELGVREIENTISRKILEKTLYGDDEPEYIKTYTGEEYASEKIYMGDFIDKHYKLHKTYSNKNKTTKKGTGTIRDKLTFAKNIASNINDINDLSEEAKKICKKIYEFIEKENGK